MLQRVLLYAPASIAQPIDRLNGNSGVAALMRAEKGESEDVHE